MRAFVAALGACLALGFVSVSPLLAPARANEDAEGRLAAGAVVGLGALAAGALRVATRA